MMLYRIYNLLIKSIKVKTFDMDGIQGAIHRFEYLNNRIPSLLIEINESDFSFKISSDKWSKKEIIGHLIDSATNNHQRFVRAQFENSPAISYDQNKWNEYNFYQQMKTAQIIDFWASYNKYLLVLIKNIPKENLLNTCTMKDGSKVTLDFLINDYVEHLEHHLKQVVNY